MKSSATAPDIRPDASRGLYMRKTKLIVLLVLVALLAIVAVAFLAIKLISVDVQIGGLIDSPRTDRYDVVELDLDKGDLFMHWKDEANEDGLHFSSLGSVIDNREDDVVFATNGGMFDIDGKPIGLYIQDGKEIKSLNRKDGHGNFHIEPNGVFYVTDDGAYVVTTDQYADIELKAEYATQSGPMLLVDGKINDQFTEGSDNLHIRSGVCARTSKDIVFIISNTEVNFYEFANEFKVRGCTNALYLDGFVSKMYAQDIGRKDTGGAFGVIVGFVKS